MFRQVLALAIVKPNYFRLSSGTAGLPKKSGVWKALLTRFFKQR
jgi:hypothetical protein